MAIDLGVPVVNSGKYYFISYNTEDAELVSRYLKSMVDKGLPVWYDYGIPEGDEWKEVIAEKIRGCEAVIMFLSSNVFKKEKSFVHKEWDIAQRRKKKIYLVILDYIDESNIPPRYDFWWSDISNTQSVSALKYGFEACVDRIIDAVGYTDVVKQDIIVENNTNSAVTDNIDSNVAQLVDQSNADDFVIENGILKKYKGNASVVSIPYGVTSIGPHAFSSCHTLTSITIPDSVISIGNNAFEDCFLLTSVVIGNGVTSIGDFAFFCCSALTSIEISDSVTKIYHSAFCCCSALTSVVIPNSVTLIDSHAFYSCTSLAEIVIPDSVTNIGDWAFYDCDSLHNIYYTGSKISWNKIDIGFHNQNLINATIHYNYIP